MLFIKHHREFIFFLSPCMDECTAATLAAGIHGQFHGGALKIFFNKLSTYLKYPITFVFVFDGDERPNSKRGHAVRSTPPWWTGPSQELINHFGFHVHQVCFFVSMKFCLFLNQLLSQAPGEAEAELAKLNLLGLIDGVITSDSDIFIFGASCVLRR